MGNRRLWFMVLTGILCLFSFGVFAEGVEIFEPDEVLQAAMDSKLSYSLEKLEGGAAQTPKRALVSPSIQLAGEGGERKVSVYKPNDTAAALIKKGEAEFFAKDYKAALGSYNAAIKADPGYLAVYNLIGDAYFMMKDYENAKKWFTYSVKVNFCNYQAHWFLADTLSYMGDNNGAAYEATVGHILNRNHAELKKIMIFYRDAAGKPWREWAYEPVCNITKKDKDTIIISATAEWTVYGMSRALWLYEPGYTQKHGIDPSDKALVNYVREAEGMISAAKGEGSNPALGKISLANDLMPFFLYEVMAVEEPARMALTGESQLQAIMAYLDTYHTAGK